MAKKKNSQLKTVASKKLQIKSQVKSVSSSTSASTSTPAVSLQAPSTLSAPSTPSTSSVPRVPATVKSISMKSSPQSTPQDDYFVSIRKPAELRRQLLECAKKSVYGLQNYYRLQLLREKKTKELDKLKRSVQELAYLNTKFNERLPTLPHQEILPKQDTSTLPLLDTRKSTQTDKSDLDKLEESLKHIELKLRNLQ